MQTNKVRHLKTVARKGEKVTLKIESKANKIELSQNLQKVPKSEDTTKRGAIADKTQSTQSFSAQ